MTDQDRELDKISRLIFECTCGGEAIRIEGVDWDDWREVWLCYWHYGHHQDRSWRARLNHIKRIIRRGHPYTDMVTLDLKTARKLAQSLLEYVDLLESGRNESISQ